MQYSDGRTYFFKNGKYFKFDDARISVEEAEPSYPRDTGRVGGILTWLFYLHFICTVTRVPKQHLVFNYCFKNPTFDLNSLNACLCL